jgi:hypothetical protein
LDETQINNVLATDPDKELLVESRLEGLERTWNQGAMSRSQIFQDKEDNCVTVVLRR